MLMKDLYDCHVHLNLPQYNEVRDEVITESLEALDFMVNVGFDEKSCEDSLALAYRHEKIYAALGIHPTSASSFNAALAQRLDKMLLEDKAIALGEIGLDYYWMKDSPEIQKDVFYQQMSIAEGHNLPVIIHDRDAHDDVMDILLSFKGRVRGILHSFSADSRFAKKAADLGWFFSVSGPVTFKNRKNDTLREAVASLPVDRILIETDSPYLAPHPLRGTVNRPANVEIIASMICGLKGMEMEEFLGRSRLNAASILEI